MLGSYQCAVHGLAAVEHAASGVSEQIRDITLSVAIAGPVYAEEFNHWSCLLDPRETEDDYWLNLPIESKRALLAVRRRRFNFQRESEPVIDAHEVFILNGTRIRDVPSFFLTLGQALRGRNGYMGSSLAEMEECIRGVGIRNGAFTLIVENSDVARAYLDRYSELVEIAEELSVRLRFLDHQDLLPATLESLIRLSKDPASFFDQACESIAAMGVRLICK